MVAARHLTTMSLPGAVSMVIDEEHLIDRVSLDEHRTLFVTPDTAVAHRERSLLTEESVDTYPTDARELGLEEGKRQSTVTFVYDDGERKALELPTETRASALKALLASTIKATGTVAADESIIELYRFKELTVIVTDRRLLKHVGRALWADSFDVIEYEAVRDIRIEAGQVSTGINIDLIDGSDRLKVPHDTADDLVDRLETAVCEYHDVAALGVLRGDPDAGKPDPEPDLDRLRPLSVGDDRSDDGTTLLADPAIERVEVDDELLEELSALRSAIEHQQAQLEDYAETIERIERELTRGR